MLHRTLDQAWGGRSSDERTSRRFADGPIGAAVNTPGIRGRAYRSDALLAAFEEHLRLGFSVVVMFEDPVFTVTGVAQHTAGVREGAGVALPLAIRRFLERAGAKR